MYKINQFQCYPFGKNNKDTKNLPRITFTLLDIRNDSDDTSKIGQIVADRKTYTCHTNNNKLDIAIVRLLNSINVKPYLHS